MNDESAKRNQLEGTIAGIIADEIGVDISYVKPKKRFIEDLRVDSVTGVEIVMAVENEFGIQIADEDIEKLTTVALLIEYVKRHSRK
jgi:acyl carrier protein